MTAARAGVPGLPSGERRAGPASAGAMAAVLCLLGACHPTAPATPQAGADPLIGTWTVNSRDEGGTEYTGTLDVRRRTGEGVYAADLDLLFTGHDGSDMEVEQDAVLTVDGSTVKVKCSNPVVVTENGDYHADRFLLTRVSQTVMQGGGKDSYSVGGTITLTKK